MTAVLFVKIVVLRWSRSVQVHEITRPRCLCSLHVDCFPGDRENRCGGLMRPIRVEPDPRKGFVIVHQCEKCGEIKRNRACSEANIQPDNLELLILLTVNREK